LVIAAGITDTNGNQRINDEVRHRLNETADDLGAPGRDRHYGYGLVDADEAVGVTPNTPPSVTITAPPDGSTFADGEVIKSLDTKRLKSRVKEKQMLEVQLAEALKRWCPEDEFDIFTVDSQPRVASKTHSKVYTDVGAANELLKQMCRRNDLWETMLRKDILKDLKIVRAVITE